MNNLNTLSSNEDIKDKIIFLRVDFNIPIKDGKVIDDTKIVNMKDIINKLLSKKTKIIVCSILIPCHSIPKVYRVYSFLLLDVV